MRIALALLFAAFAVFSVYVKSELRQERSPIEGLRIGEKMPDFSLRDPSGAEVSLSSALNQNKIIAINFWASWCGPCRLEMPGFEKLYASKHPEGFTILAVNEDEKRADMDDYLARKPITFPVLLDPGSGFMKQLHVRALPTTILVGRDGRIRQVTEGIQQYLSVFVDAELKASQAKPK